MLKIEKAVSAYLGVRTHQWVDENERQYDDRPETMDNILCEFYMIQMITTCQNKTRNKLFLLNNIERNDCLIEVVMLLNNHSINLAMEVLVLLTFLRGAPYLCHNADKISPSQIIHTSDHPLLFHRNV